MKIAPETRKLFRHWVKTLALAPPAWEKITLRPLDEAAHPNDVGLCEQMPEERRATVFLASEERHGALPVEETIVHELLHLRLDGHISLYDPKAEAYDPQYEAGLNVIAKLLVRLRQNERKKK